MAGTVIVPWYATGFRADDLEHELNQVAAVALALRRELLRGVPLARRQIPLPAARRLRGAPRLGTLLGRSRDDVLQGRHSSWYQVPVLYGWWDRTTGGTVLTEAPGVGNGAPNGRGNGVGSRSVALPDGRAPGTSCPTAAHDARERATNSN